MYLSTQGTLGSDGVFNADASAVRVDSAGRRDSAGDFFISGDFFLAGDASASIGSLLMTLLAGIAFFSLLGVVAALPRAGAGDPTPDPAGRVAIMLRKSSSLMTPTFRSLAWSRDEETNE